jgi:hypothetical protein
LTTITAITEEYLGYWEKQGWSNDASINPNSRIDVPEEDAKITTVSFAMQGIGFSGEEGIAKVEVSWDNGKTWVEAELTRGPTPYVWTSWNFRGQSPEAGQHFLLARVTDKAGRSQTREAKNFLKETFPNGSSGMHAVVVEFQKT